MKTILALFFVIMLFIGSDHEKLIRFTGKPEIFTTDKLGNIYIYFDSQVVKYTPEGIKTATFTSYETGKLYFLDASDPMQLMLFYKDFNQVQFLDNRLNQLGKPLFPDIIDFSAVSSICKSRQFAVWMCDEYQNKLIHYGFNPSKILCSINLENSDIAAAEVTYMLESGNEVYLYAKNKGIWVFDYTGTLTKKIDLVADKHFQIRNNQLIYSHNGKIILFNLQDGKSDTIIPPHYKSFDLARIENGNIYVLNYDSLKIFSSE
ncbi:MAG: hypothetical protein U0W24_11645 [Bacteroidales bacterium]